MRELLGLYVPLVRRGRSPKIEWYVFTCDYCGGVFVPVRRDAKYCSGRCRVAAFRKRRRLGKEVV